ncbi:MAG: hypothetical protein EXS13_11100 [Planctomycetes bacterium]|nr:hypothetical protein [Planctomycetota bacterium]
MAAWFVAGVVGLVGVVSAAVAAASSARADDDGESAVALEATLARAREAHGRERFAASGRELVIEGDAIESGLDGAWSLRIAADGRFAEHHRSRFPTRSGDDGVATWRVDWSGLAERTVLEEQEFARLNQALWSGSWCAPSGSPVVVSSAGAGRLSLRVCDGRMTGRLELDPESGLPRELRLDGYRGERVLRFGDWRATDGDPTVPWTTVIDDDSQITSYTVAKVALVAADAGAFRRPESRPSDTTFDLAAPSALPCKLAPTGHLLVRATLDGVDRGRFIFDSGAGGMVIDPDLAAELGLEPFGKVWIGGAGAERSDSSFYSARELVVGPVTMARPRLSGLQMDHLSGSFGEPLAGIVGYDFFARVVATIDMKAGTVTVEDPATYQRDGVTWRELTLHGGHPHVECALGHPDEERSLYRLDTGAAGVAVLFHSPFVRDAGLLDGRVTTAFQGLNGIGGSSAARIGMVDWFELGGVVHDEPTVIFVMDPRGALADPYTAGTIGGELLEQQLLILDYPHQRVGFAPR